MSGYSHTGSGAVVGGQNATLNPLPQSGVVNAGDLLLLFTYSFFGSFPTPTVSGWTLLSKGSNAQQVAIYGRIATGSDLAEVAWGNILAYAWIESYTGNPSSLTGIIHNSTDRDQESINAVSTNGLAFSITVDGCLVIAAGARNKTSTTDGATFGAFNGGSFTTRTMSVPNGSSIAGIFADWIQTSQTNVAANNNSFLSIADSNEPYQGTLLALLPPAALALAANAGDVTSASAMLAPRLQGAALDTTSAVSGLTTWASVTLAAPLYSGIGGALDPNFWTGGNIPAAGDTLYYDPTYITIETNAEIISTSNNCSAIVQFNDGSGNAVGLIVIVPTQVAYASDTTSATGNLTSFINLAAAASDAVTAVGTLSGNNQLQGAAADVITATGALFEAISLASAAADTTSATATLGTQNQLNGAANDVVTALAALTTAALFQGSAADITSAAATLVGAPFVTSALNPINIGSTPGDGTGDAARVGFLKIKADLTTLLSAVANRPTAPGTFGVTSAVGTALMLIDTSQTWETNQFAGQTVTVTSGTLPAMGAPTVPTSNAGYSRIIQSNTANALTWENALPFAVGLGVGYQISAAQINAGSSGFATAVGETNPSTIADTNQSWSADEWVGSQVTMMGGPYAGQASLIVSNDGISLTLATEYATPIPAGTPYVIGQRPVGTSGITATLATTQNDYAAPGWVAGMKRQLLGPPSGGATITGFDATGVEDGDEFMLRNTSATDPILMPHLSGLSQTVNMISCPGGLEYELPPLTNVRLSYVENVWTIYA